MEKRYNIIYADPPWKYDRQKGEGVAADIYQTMSLAEIESIPVNEIAADDAVLFLWVTFPKLKEGLSVIESWGFKYKTCAFNWIKQNPKSDSFFVGLGFWTRSCSEICLLATKGHPHRVSVNEFGYVNIPYMLSIYEADRDTLIKELDGIIFLNPDRYNENNSDAGWETADEYLSGNVRDKLRVAKAMAADTDNPQAERFAANAAALEEVQPEWIEASDIDVKIGTTWIEPLDYEQFIYELLNTPKRARAIRTEYYNSGIQVHLNKMSMEWFIENKSMDKHFF